MFELSIKDYIWGFKNNQTKIMALANERIKKYSIIYKNFLGITLEELLIRYEAKMIDDGLEIFITQVNPGGQNRDKVEI